MSLTSVNPWSLLVLFVLQYRDNCYRKFVRLEKDFLTIDPALQAIVPKFLPRFARARSCVDENYKFIQAILNHKGAFENSRVVISLSFTCVASSKNFAVNLSELFDNRKSTFSLVRGAHEQSALNVTSVHSGLVF